MCCNKSHKELSLGGRHWAGRPEGWLMKLSRKCFIATIITLAVVVGVLFIKAWPGCFISAAMLVFAITTSAMCLYIQFPNVSYEMVSTYVDKCSQDFFNRVVDTVLIWEGFCLAAGLACLSLPWWVVMIAEIINITVLWSLLMSVRKVIRV